MIDRLRWLIEYIDNIRHQINLIFHFESNLTNYILLNSLKRIFVYNVINIRCIIIN